MITGVSQVKSAKVKNDQTSYFIAAGTLRQDGKERFYTSVAVDGVGKYEMGETIRYDSLEEQLADFDRVVQKYKDIAGV